ncbi:MAG: class I SAM-dependent methyltransferase [Labilithrix sp.]|nr:class I SAM-dependent methyltransferase [Labilithrix sp.]
MREGRASTTATLVAAARGAAGVDPIASRLVPRGLSRVARPGRHRIVRRLPMVEHMRARTLAADRAIVEAIEDGSRQLVVLGAGLCARAWRMPVLAETIVYEVDHPSTQRYKRSRLAELEPKAREVRFASVDFEAEDLSLTLANAGHDASAGTTWIWEGVTPYLTPLAIARTLEGASARSAAGSTLIMTYAMPVARSRGRFAEWLLHEGLRAIGEPLEGLMGARAAHRLVEASGFEITKDARVDVLGGKRRAHALVAERLLVAVRR